MMRILRVARFAGVCAAAAGLVLSGCAGTTPKPETGEIFACAADSQIEKNIAPEAEVVDFSCVMKPWEGSDTLHFMVSLKNISDQPQRYRVNIFMDNGKAVGGLIPRKTSGGLVAPGQTASFTYPVGGMQQAPDSIVLMIKTMSQ